MKKLRLDYEDLRVESFSTGPARVSRGTVRGMVTDPFAPTWWESECPVPTNANIENPCNESVWEVGCSEETAASDCYPTEGGYYYCKTYGGTALE